MPKKRKKNSNVNAKGRSQYNAEQYLHLPYNIIRSPQFRSLNGNDVRVLLEISSRHNGYNNGRIGAGQEDLANILMMSKSTSKRALENLQKTKFIVCQKQGRFTLRLASEWRVTFINSVGLPSTNEWGQEKALENKRKRPPRTLVEEMMDEIEKMQQAEI